MSGVVQKFRMFLSKRFLRFTDHEVVNIFRLPLSLKTKFSTKFGKNDT